MSAHSRSRAYHNRLVRGQVANVLAYVSEAGPAKLDVWIGFNGNGVFEDTAFERITDSQAATRTPLLRSYRRL